MGRFNRVVWSPVEIEHLKGNLTEPVEQLCIALAKTKTAVARKKAELQGKPLPVSKKPKNNISNIGRREDLNLFLRSGWEANTARWLNSRKLEWEYEPQVFFFEGIKHGTVNYTPDFRVNGSLSYAGWCKTKKAYSWIEVKGRLEQKDKTRMRRFKKFFPDEFARLVVIVGSRKTKAGEFFKSLGVPDQSIVEYIQLNKEMKEIVAHWE